MVRSMYSGVAGMKAHQTKMDVIGNNIANVNTYGFKSSRVTFRDLFYQNIRGASAGTANAGGINPSAVGYGASVSSVDTLMTTSTLTSTGNPLDVAIMGEGFFQVMDNDGNIFYTKAGMLDIDANGNLVDTNGYFVLGTSGDPLGKSPGSEKIQFQIPNVTPRASSGELTINDITYTISASNYTNDGNVSFTFTLDNSLALGQDCKATISGSNIIIGVNPDAIFGSIGDFEKAVNTAITAANSGKAHPAGNFNFTTTDTAAFTGVTGYQIVNSNSGYNKGNITLTDDDMYGGLKIIEVGDHFFSAGDVYIKAMTHNAVDDELTIEFEVNSITYKQTISTDQLASGKNILLESGTDNDTITIYLPSWDTMTNHTSASVNSGVYSWNYSTTASMGTAVKSELAGELGLTQMALTKGTSGGAQSIKDLTGISIGADGVIIATHSDVDGFLTLGRIDLATFDNPNGLQQAGQSYYQVTPNSGEAYYAVAGTGGTGSLANSALEMSNVDLSNEFADIITTQRGFQANSRLITVSDTMLEELINLKR